MAGTVPSTGTVSWETFAALPEDDLRELIDGELVEVDAPTDLHEHIVAVLIAFLYSWTRSHGGRVLGSSYKIRVDDHRGVMPDVQLYRAGNRVSIDQQGGLEEGRPDLVVEVVSPTSGRYDQVTKLRWYAALGVPEYWLVHPEQQWLQRFVLEGDRYVVAGSLAADDVLAPETFAGLEIPLAELWHDE